MKRCIICGNVGDDSSTVCEVCGNPYINTPENTAEADVDSAAQTAERQPEQAAPAQAERRPAGDRKAAGAERPANGAAPAGAARPQRRMRSAPQIYGQDMPGDPSAYGRQGTIRRTVNGRSAGAAPSANQGAAGQARANGAAQPRPANAGQGQSRPAGAGRQGMPAQRMPAQNMPQARPAMASPAAHNRRVMETARGMLRSPLFVLITVLFTVQLISSIAAIFMDQMNYSQVVRLINSFDIPVQMARYTNSIQAVLRSLDSGAILANLVLRIPDILFCVGLWMIFLMAMTAGEEMSGVGFGLVRAVVIINLVVSSLAMVACLVFSVAFVIASWASGAQDALIAAVIVLVLMVVITMAVVMYHFCHLATWTTCRVNGNAGESYGRVSRYVAVVHIIMALTAIVNLLSGIVNAEITGITGAIGKMGWMILFAVWIFLYRDKMEELNEY